MQNPDALQTASGTNYWHEANSPWKGALGFRAV